MTPAARLARLLPDARPDGALLAAFLADRDEAAFAELVRRHGPLVLAACRRLLPDPADAADAFQAAFLVLVRRARRLTGAADLGPWLYRVAAWTARNVRRKNARRLARTAPLSETVAATPASPVPALDLDAALLALPEKYRAALVLCHLQGWSRRDAAARLGCPEGTLSSLLARGLTKLKARLPGYEPAVALAVVPAALSAATVSAAAKPVPSAAAELAAAVLRALWVPKASAATAGVALVFALGAGVGLSVREAPAVAQAPTAPAPREKAAPPEREAYHVARFRAFMAESRDRLRKQGVTLDRAKADLSEAQAALARSGTATDRDRVKQAEEAVRQAEGQIRSVKENWLRLGEIGWEGASTGKSYQITGTLATDVTVPEKYRPRVAAAVEALIDGSTDVSDSIPGATWDTARRGAHVLVQFPAPRQTVAIPGGPDLRISEALVSLPLTRSPGGFVLVRDGDRIVRFSKFPHAAAERFQEALGAAEPAR